MTLSTALQLAGVVFTQTGDELHLRCPFCAEEDYLKKTLSVNTKKGAAKCFRCSFRSRTHTVTKIIRALRLNLSHVDEVSVARTNVESDSVILLPDGYKRLRGNEEFELEAEALQYVLKRGISKQQIREKRIGVSLYGRYAYRVIFPAWKEKQLATFVARDFTGSQEPKYLNAVTGKCLYNLPSRAKEVILAEGVFKALRIEQTFPTVASCAILGNRITDAQVSQLVAAGVKKATLWPDPDGAGRTGAVETAEKLLVGGFGVDVVWPIKRPADEDGELAKTGNSRRPFTWSTAMILRSK